MKKLTKKLGMSTLALASVFALGFSAVNTTANNSNQESVSTYATYEGDINSVEGVTLIDAATIPTFKLVGDTVTGATISVNASTYNHTNSAYQYTNQISYEVTITMPTSYTWTSGDENALRVGFTTSNSTIPTETTDVVWFGNFTHSTVSGKSTFTATGVLPRTIATWNIVLFANDSAQTTYNNETVNSTTNPDGKTMYKVYSQEVNTWEYDAELKANPEFMPYYDNGAIDFQINEVGSVYNATLNYSFDLHINGFDHLVKGQNTESNELALSGVVYIPYIDQLTTDTFESTYKGYLIDVQTDNNNEFALVMEQTAGADTISTIDDIYSVEVNLNLNNVSYMIIDETYNVGYNLVGTPTMDNYEAINDPTLDPADAGGSTVGNKQDERVSTVKGSILYADSYTSNTAGAIDVDMDGNGYVDAYFGGNNGNVAVPATNGTTTVNEGVGVDSGNIVYLDGVDLNNNGLTTDSFSATADDVAGASNANYARYNTMNQNKTQFTASLQYNTVTVAANGNTTVNPETKHIRVLSKSQYSAAMQEYNQFLAGNPWAIDGTNTAITAIVLASIFGVTTIGLGAYIVVNNNKSKKASAPTTK